MQQVEAWTQPQWLAAVHTWITGQLDQHDIVARGPIEQYRARPWSVQLRVATDRGALWFKQNTPAMQYEVPLVDVLARLVPDRVVAPLATDHARGWMLTPDAGVTLASQDGGGDEASWMSIVGEFADLQRELIDHADEITAAGVPEFRPLDVPAWVRAYAGDLAARPPGDLQRVDKAEAARIIAAADAVADDAELLAGAAIPLSLEHNDLHANNVFSPARDRPLRFFDFGDALWAHPFSSMRIALAVAADRPDVRVDHVAGAYLERWSGYADPAALRELLRAALRFGAVNRAHSWRMALSATPSDQLGELARAASEWLGRLADET